MWLNIDTIKKHVKIFYYFNNLILLTKIKNNEKKVTDVKGFWLAVKKQKIYFWLTVISIIMGLLSSLFGILIGYLYKSHESVNYLVLIAILFSLLAFIFLKKKRKVSNMMSDFLKSR